eukprot:jgi/Bigna1/88883/estExt_fgenesh1_pg.C_390145
MTCDLRCMHVRIGFRRIREDSRIFQNSLEFSGRFSKLPECSRRFWKILESSGMFSKLLEDSRSFSKIPEVLRTSMRMCAAQRAARVDVRMLRQLLDRGWRGQTADRLGTCPSSRALERLRREAVRNAHASESPETQFEMALQHLCDEEDEEKLQRDFEDELDFLRRKRHRCVDVPVLGLIDDGAQPAATSEAPCQKSKSSGVGFGCRPMAGEVGGSSSSIENEILREVDFTVQIKRHKKHGAHVKLRTLSLASLGPVSQDFALGTGALNVNGIDPVKDPDPAKRVVTTNGEIVNSCPCSVDVMSATVATVVGMDVPPMAAAPGEICSTDANAVGELPGAEEVSSVVRKELQNAVDHDFVDNHDHVINAQGLPDVDVKSMANPIESDGVLLQRSSSVAPLSEFGDQRAVANSDLANGHVLDMLDRLLAWRTRWSRRRACCRVCSNSATFALSLAASGSTLLQNCRRWASTSCGNRTMSSGG